MMERETVGREFENVGSISARLILIYSWSGRVMGIGNK